MKSGHCSVLTSLFLSPTITYFFLGQNIFGSTFLSSRPSKSPYKNHVKTSLVLCVLYISFFFLEITQGFTHDFER